MNVLDRPTAVVRPRAVFVAPTDRRARRLLLAGRVAGGAFLAYLGLAVASLVGAPWVPHLALPRPGPNVRAAAGSPPATLPQTAQSQATPDLKRPVAVSTTTAPKPAATVTPRPAPTTAPSASVAPQPGPAVPGPVSSTPSAPPSTGQPSTTTNPSSGHPGTTAPGHTRHG